MGYASANERPLPSAPIWIGISNGNGLVDVDDDTEIKNVAATGLLMEHPPHDLSNSETISAEELAGDVSPVQAAGEVAEIGAAADVDFQSVDRNYIDVERLALLILFAVATVGAAIAVVVMWLSGVEWWLQSLAAAGMILGCVLLLLSALLWPGIEYRHIRWRLSEKGLEIQRGVFFKHQIAVPWARAQHADVSQGPLQRIFEIGSLTVHTAGTKNSSVTIDGLNHAQALRLRDEIIRQRKAIDVV